MLSVVEFDHGCSSDGGSGLDSAAVSLELLGGKSLTSAGSTIVASGTSGTGIRASGGVSSWHLYIV